LRRLPERNKLRIKRGEPESSRRKALTQEAQSKNIKTMGGTVWRAKRAAKPKVKAPEESHKERRQEAEIHDRKRVVWRKPGAKLLNKNPVFRSLKHWGKWRQKPGGFKKRRLKTFRGSSHCADQGSGVRRPIRRGRNEPRKKTGSKKTRLQTDTPSAQKCHQIRNPSRHKTPLIGWGREEKRGNSKCLKRKSRMSGQKKKRI